MFICIKTAVIFKLAGCVGRSTCRRRSPVNNIYSLTEFKGSLTTIKDSFSFRANTSYDYDRFIIAISTTGYTYAPPTWLQKFEFIASIFKARHSKILIYELAIAKYIYTGISMTNSVPSPSTELQLNCPLWISSTI
ncbi:MAG: hypothetical protein V7L11_33175 [Nostoc sp.]|uniref:hypothetical protein n=1 Tax=Nostoc sp. TaxID=1180 RepID=UPI002FF59FBE